MCNKLQQSCHDVQRRVSHHSCSNQENKKARKEAEKEQKQKALQQKRGAIEEMLAGMTEEEQQQWRQKNQVNQCEP